MSKRYNLTHPRLHLPYGFTICISLSHSITNRESSIPISFSEKNWYGFTRYYTCSWYGVVVLVEWYSTCYLFRVSGGSGRRVRCVASHYTHSAVTSRRGPGRGATHGFLLRRGFISGSPREDPDSEVATAPARESKSAVCIRLYTHRTARRALRYTTPRPRPPPRPPSLRSLLRACSSSSWARLRRRRRGGAPRWA